MEIYGLPSDTIRKEFKTKQAKGPNPVWGINSEVFTFRKVIAPQMALLRLAVFEENSNKVQYNKLRLCLALQICCSKILVNKGDWTMIKKSCGTQYI